MTPSRAGHGIPSTGSSSPPALEGVVVDLRDAGYESPDFTWHSVLLLGYGCLLSFALLPFFLALAIIVRSLERPLLWFGAIWFKLKMLMLSAGVSRSEVPVTYLRLRDLRGDQHDVRVKGNLQGGSVTVGDSLVVWGRRQSGVTLLERAQNLHTGNVVYTDVYWGRNLISWLAIGTGVLLLLCGGLGVMLVFFEAQA